MQSLIITDLFLTMGCIFGVALYMKKTGESFQQVCLRIREIFTRK